MKKRFEEDAGRFDGMSDGETRTVETPFGEVVFQFEAGDRSVGIPAGVFVVEMRVGNITFDRAALEVRPAFGYPSLADALERWAGNQ